MAVFARVIIGKKVLYDPLRMGDYTEKDLIALTKKWYRKLKQSGFDDIEVLAPNGQFYDLLKYPCKIDLNSPERKAQEKYFSLARSFNFDYEFKSKFESRVWQHHSEGTAYRKIASILRVDRNRVHNKIRELRKKMMEYYFDGE